MKKLYNDNKLIRFNLSRSRARKTLVFSFLALNISLMQQGVTSDIAVEVEYKGENWKMVGNGKIHIPTSPVYRNHHTPGHSECEDKKALERAARKVKYQNRRIEESDEQKNKADQKFTKLAQPLLALGWDKQSLFDLIGSHKEYHKNKHSILETLFSMPSVATQFERKDLSTLIDQLEKQRHDSRHYEWRKYNGEKHLKRKKRKLSHLKHDQ